MIPPQVGLVPIGRNAQSELREFAHLESGEVPVPGTNDKLAINGRTGIVLVLVPGGSFLMGAQPDERDKPNYDRHALKTHATPNFVAGGEWPVQEVRLDAFFVSKYEMTHGQWRQLAGGRVSG